MKLWITAGLFGLLLLGASLEAETGVTRDRIVLGQSCALAGPARAEGRQMATGLRAYFDHVNEQGGIQGRRIELVTQDDGHDPDRAVWTTANLIENNHVFMLIGQVGTPTAEAVLPLIRQEQVPLFAPVSGSDRLREPFNKWVVNLRSGFDQEMSKLASYLVGKHGYTRIACFYQNDDFGKAGLKSLKAALKSRGVKLAGKGKYQPKSPDCEKALKAILKAAPEAVVMIGTYEPCATFVTRAKVCPDLADITFCTISGVGTSTLKEMLGEAADGLVVSQVVPYPWDESLPLVAEYHALMRKARMQDQIGFVSLEGFMAAKLFCQVIEAMDGSITREGFVETLERVGSFDLGGITLSFGPEDHQGLDEVFVVEYRGNEIDLASE